MKKLWLVVPWAIFLVIVGAWLYYWFAVAGAAEQKLAQWSAAQRQLGADVAYGPVQRHGFPVLMRLELDNLRYRAPRAQWGVTTPRIDLNIEMLDPGHVIFEAKAPIVVTHADGATNTITADSLVASLHSRGTALVQDGIETSNLNVTDSAKPGTLHVTHAAINLRPDPAQPTQYQLAINATQLTLARPVRSFEGFGQDIASLDAGIVIEQGALMFAPQAAASSNDMLKPWRDAGGKVRFDMLQLHWGALEAQGTGQASVDDQRRLVGHVRFQLPHPAPALTALASSDKISHDARQVLQAVALGLAFSGRHVSFDVDAADGTLKIENATVRSLDPLY